VTKIDHSEDRGDIWEGIITNELKEQDEKAWNGLLWLTKRNQGPALVNTSKNLWVP
jgi:hypothetical protein